MFCALACLTSLEASIKRTSFLFSFAPPFSDLILALLVGIKNLGGIFFSQNVLRLSLLKLLRGLDKENIFLILVRSTFLRSHPCASCRYQKSWRYFLQSECSAP